MTQQLAFELKFVFSRTEQIYFPQNTAPQTLYNNGFHVLNLSIYLFMKTFTVAQKYQQFRLGKNVLVIYS